MLKRFSNMISSFCLFFSSYKTNDKERNNIINEQVFWLNNKFNGIPNNRDIKIGDVYYFHFGINILPEISYRHMGIVIAKNNKYLYVLPITSYREDLHSNAYHITKNNSKRNEYFLMKASDFPFLDHDSVVKTNDLRCISGIKKSSHLKYHIDVNSEFFVNLYDRAHQSIFNDKAFLLDEMRKEFVDVLENEVYTNEINVNLTEKVNVEDYIKCTYKYSIEQQIIDTSQVGTKKYKIKLIDKFQNVVQKELVVNVVTNMMDEQDNYLVIDDYPSI